MSGQSSAARVAAILMGAAAASPLVVSAEGWVLRAYRDPVGIVTDCAGTTQGVVMGQVRTEGECQARLLQALVDHGQGIAACLPDSLPIAARGAFTSFAYNVGVQAFCTSSLARKASAGDLAGACAELSRWIHAQGRVLPGLVKRRAAERALCEQGLRP